MELKQFHIRAGNAKSRVVCGQQGNVALPSRQGDKANQHCQSLLASWESLQVFIRLIRCWMADAYAVPVQSILMAVGAVIYFVSSFDLIPDAVPVLGLVDDVWVIIVG